MKIQSKLIAIGIVFLSIFCYSPLNSQHNFQRVDSIAFHFDNPINTVEDLAQQLTKDIETEIEKARVFYMWIAKNIRYDCRKFHNLKPIEIQARSRTEMRHKVDEMRKAGLGKTLSSHKGICEDYSRLFKALCDAIELEAVIIKGDARDFHRPFRNKHDYPHAWNAVKIDNKWYLLDSTWGAGYTNAEVTKFTRRVTDGYFFTSPSMFSINHLPDDDKWQLLEQPISLEEFADQPLINYGHKKYRIIDYSKNVKESKDLNSKVEFWIKFYNKPPALVIVNKKGKKIDFVMSEKDGKVIFLIPKSSSRNIVLFGGRSMRSRMERLAFFRI